MREAVVSRVPPSHRAIAVLWPSFVTAIIASGVFFSAFRPRDLLPFDLDLDPGPLASYSIGFLLFWLIAALSSYGTLYFTLSNAAASGTGDPPDKP